MDSAGLVELGPCTLVERAARLVDVERRFGLGRAVEGGLFRLRLFGGDGPPPTITPDFADWVEAQLGAPTLSVRFRQHRGSSYASASYDELRALLLPEERFGARSPDDSAWFDVTPDGNAGIAERDQALHALLAALHPALLCCIVDVRRLELDAAPMGIFLLASERAGVVCLGATVSPSVQLDTRAQAALFRDGAT
ncbi:MAG: hypothetical protein IT383_12195 [Deltaproteobacteria bacterium]|nr:hypothetical protein [Deltaproteobacteria bacterium]